MIMEFATFTIALVLRKTRAISEKVAYLNCLTRLHIIAIL